MKKKLGRGEMYNKIRLYSQGWSKVDHGSQCIETNLDNEFVIKKSKEDRFQIFKDGKLVAGVFASSIEIEDCLLEYTPSVNRIGFAWISPDGGKIALSGSRRSFTINDSDTISIYKQGGIIDTLISMILDRNFKIKDKFHEVYFSSEINPVYVICVLLVAMFESTGTS